MELTDVTVCSVFLDFFFAVCLRYAGSRLRVASVRMAFFADITAMYSEPS